MAAAVVITGAPGSGKSSVLDALTTLLEIEGVGHGALETEELTRGLPPLPSELLTAQLEHALELQRGAGRRLFLIAFTAESDAQLRSLAAAVRSEATLVVCLRAPAETLAARLREREPERWPGKQGLIAHARALADAVPALEGVDLVLDTDGSDPEEVALAVLAAMRERAFL
jgi:broad-specificity NMP kinase